MAVFGRELMGRTVLDKTGEKVGTIVDIVVDLATGTLSEFHVRPAEDLVVDLLPFERNDSGVIIPTGSVSRIAAQIHLAV